MMTDRTKEIIQRIAIKHSITFKEALLVYKSQFHLIRELVSEVEFKDIPEDKLDKLKLNFNIPRIGKMWLNKPRVLKIMDVVNNKKK